MHLVSMALGVRFIEGRTFTSISEGIFKCGLLESEWSEEGKRWW